MILNDQTIRQSVEQKKIEVEPLPEDEQYQPASLDVRIGAHTYDPVENTTVQTNEVVLHPGDFILGETVERVSLPADIAALLTGRSSVGRQGVVVHATAGWIDPGFDGRITLEMYNMSDEPVAFDVGERVAQLVFFQMVAPAVEPYDGQYQGQDGPVK